MSLWGYDVVFFRVICVSVLAIGFIFTVILTNVFVDVDGYLVAKNQNIHSTEITPEKRIKQDYLYEEQNYIDDDSGYRSRRSLVSNYNSSTKRNANYNKVLNSHLEELLEELSKEEDVTTTRIATTTPIKKTTTTPTRDYPKQERQNVVNKKAIDISTSNEVVHRALHEILLEGIEEHIDIGQIYNAMKNVRKVSNVIIKKKKDRSDEEHLLINEILKCKKLEDEVEELDTEKYIETTEATEKSVKHNDPIILKSEIQIWNEDKKQNFTHGKIKGFIKMIYNGKLVNLTQMQNNLVSRYDDNKRDTEELTTKKIIPKYKKKNDDKAAIRKLLKYQANLPLYDKDRTINSLLRRFYLNKKVLLSSVESQNTAERHKRQINNDYLDYSTNKSMINSKNSKAVESKHIDIEIETHFDGKDVKEGRKQFISHLIDKIRRALGSDADKLSNSIQNEFQLKKRKQDPIPDSGLDLYKSKMIPPFDRVERRDLDEISKILKNENYVQDKIDNVLNSKPKFLSSSQALNSAEMQKLNINYDRVLENGVAKRYQKPITDTSVEKDDIRSQIYSDLGNVSFLLKNIDGTGFTIGFNQYRDEAPDKESFRAFNGLENLIKEYHNIYDYGDAYSQIETHDTSDEDKENQHTISKRSVYLLPRKENKNKRNTNISIFKPIIIKKIKRIPTYIKSNKRIVRSINVQKINQVKINCKVKKINLNPNIMNENKIVRKNRSKRHIDNIRITAKNKITPIFNSSDEHMPLKNENKAYFLKESKLRNIIIKTQSDELHDYAMPFDRMYNVKSPSIKSFYEINPYVDQLMLNYPHIFVENNNAFKSKAYESGIMNNKRISSKPKKIQFMAGKKISTAASSAEDPLLEVQGILNAIIPKSRYQIALNILPQHNDTHTGFKEIHTSVNKSFEKNGLHYISLLNLSAVSKIEKLNISGNSTSNEHKQNIEVEDSKERIDQKNMLTHQKRKIDEQLVNLVKESGNLDNIIQHIYSVGKDVSKESLNAYSYRKNDAKGGTYKLEDDIRRKIKTDKSDFEDSTRALNLQKPQISESTRPSDSLMVEILSKIDSNTNILKAFLDKLYNQIAIVPQNKELNKRKQTTPVISDDFTKLLTKNMLYNKVNETVSTVRNEDLKQSVLQLQIPDTVDKKAIYKNIIEISKDSKMPADNARPYLDSNNNNREFKLNNSVYYFNDFGNPAS